MEPIILAAGASFILGASGYVIVQYWIRPIGRYRRLKRRLVSDLKPYDAASSEKPVVSPSPDKDRAKTLRKHSVDLTDAYTYDLPLWYRMVLDSRGESPLDASKSLMRLSGTRDPTHFPDRLKEIRRSLGI